MKRFSVFSTRSEISCRLHDDFQPAVNRDEIFRFLYYLSFSRILSILG
jgi:hypothetical protein